MKKNILLISALAIVALAVFNLNLSFNKETKIGVGMKSPLTVAKNEEGGKCGTFFIYTRLDECWFSMDYKCINGGYNDYCYDGFEVNNECPPYNQWHNWTQSKCN